MTVIKFGEHTGKSLRDSDTLSYYLLRTRHASIEHGDIIYGMNVPCVARTGDSVFHERALAASSSSRGGSCLAPKLIGLGRYMWLEKNRE